MKTNTERFWYSVIILYMMWQEVTPMANCVWIPLQDAHLGQTQITLWHVYNCTLLSSVAVLNIYTKWPLSYRSFILKSGLKVDSKLDCYNLQKLFLFENEEDRNIVLLTHAEHGQSWWLHFHNHLIKSLWRCMMMIR